MTSRASSGRAWMEIAMPNGLSSSSSLATQRASAYAMLQRGKKQKMF